MKLIRFWYEFTNSSQPTLLRLFGVTAWTNDDALAILRQAWPAQDQFQLTKSISDVDIRTLDANHVLPNMGICAVRGIWFPHGYQ